MSEPHDPNIFSYLDYRKYLRDWFEAKKRSNPRFSHRVFARMAQQKSPSLLTQVIQGKRNLSPRNVDRFVAALKLEDAPARFFRNLVRFNQSRSEAERNLAWRRLASSKRFKEASSIESMGFDYLSRWYYPAIRELASCPGFKDDPGWVARTLHPHITTSQAKRALEMLFESGLLARAEDGSTILADTTLVTAREVEGLAAHNYHRGMLELAQKSIEGATAEERHLCAATVAVPAALLPQLKDELNQLQERILDLCDGADEPGDRVYQCHLTLFPLSGSTVEKSK